MNKLKHLPASKQSIREKINELCVSLTKRHFQPSRKSEKGKEIIYCFYVKKCFPFCNFHALSRGEMRENSCVNFIGLKWKSVIIMISKRRQRENKVNAFKWSSKLKKKTEGIMI